jgi:two-component system response regulator AtoC
MATLQVLIVDDEAAIRQVLASQLDKAGHLVDTAGDGATALQRLSRGDFDVCLCDLRLPDIDGVEVLRRARAQGVETAFLMMTAFASVATAIEAMKTGAFDYLVKPLRHEDVLHRLAQIGDMLDLRAENRRLRSLLDEQQVLQWAPQSGPMREVEALVAKIAPTDTTVLITGESGTGKSFVARAIHGRSQRAGRPFIAVNCGAVPENLLESEFFGHLKGAFTGADRAKKGLFQEADGGTLFLDEICELPLPLQVKLLHALEEKEIRPLGAERARRVDVRIVAATNRNVEQAVTQGQFREDLYYRLNVLRIHLPPLRERGADLVPLIHHFLRRCAQRLGRRQEYRLDPLAEQALMDYPWPGNLRELQNVLDRALIFAEDGELRAVDLPVRLDAAPPEGEGAPSAAADGALREQVRRYELNLIRQAIAGAGGDRQLAARRLGIGLSTLYRKLEDGAPVH